MDIRYKSDANHNYMVIKKEKGSKVNHEKMVMRNNIEGLLKMNLHFIDEEVYYYYEIQSKQSLLKLYDGRYMSYEELVNFFHGMVRVFKELETYLLPADELIFDPEMIYVDIDTCMPEFAYYPSENPGGANGEGFLGLAEFLTEHADREDRRCSQLAYDYYSRVCDGVYSPEGLFRPVNGFEPKPERSYSDESFEEEDREEAEFDYWETEEDMSELDYFLKNDEPEKKDTGAFRIAAVCLGLIVLAAVFYLILVLNPSMLNFEEPDEKVYIASGCVIALLFGSVLTVFIFFYNRLRTKRSKKEPEERNDPYEPERDLYRIENEKKEYAAASFLEDEDDENKTTLLTYNDHINAPASLSGREFGKNLFFTIDRDPFVLGKKKDKADGIINDSGVSRLHASLRRRDGRYFVSDLNSTNGTFINGRRLEPNETAALEDGDTLQIAGTCLKFRI